MNHGIISPEIYSSANTEQALAVIRSYPELQDSNTYIAFPKDISIRKGLFSWSGDIQWRHINENINNPSSFSEIEQEYQEYMQRTKDERQSQAYLNSIGQKNDMLNAYLQQEKREWDMIKNTWVDNFFPHEDVHVDSPFYFTPNLKESRLEADVNRAFPTHSVSESLQLLLGRNTSNYNSKSDDKEKSSQYLTVA